jgi:hypothetical protein
MGKNWDEDEELDAIVRVGAFIGRWMVPRHDADRWEFASERRSWPWHRGGLHAGDEDEDDLLIVFFTKGYWAVLWQWIGPWWWAAYWAVVVGYGGLGGKPLFSLIFFFFLYFFLFSFSILHFIFFNSI